MGQAGVEFLELAPRSRRMLKDWIFTQLLAAAQRDSVESVFAQRLENEEATELQFSPVSRPVIPLQPAVVGHAVRRDIQRRPERLRVAGLAVPLSLQGLAGLVDALVLLCAVLLFTLTSLAMTDVLPSWTVGVAFLTAVTAAIAGLYWFIFSTWFGTTPGQRLALLARFDSAARRCEEDRTRFR